MIVLHPISPGADRAWALQSEERTVLIVGESEQLAPAIVPDPILRLRLPVKGHGEADPIEPRRHLADFGLDIGEFAALVEFAPAIGPNRRAIEALGMNCRVPARNIVLLHSEERGGDVRISI